MDLSRRRQKPAKYHGLVNQGATCYLNSVLQVLYMTEDFRETVKRNDATEHIDNDLKDLFINLDKHDAYTDKITKRLKIENVYEQRDAAEHYEKILRWTSPEASQIFRGELINYNTCQKCKTKTESAARFWNLPLALVNSNNYYSVEKGIADFFHPSLISGDDQMYCETCDEKCDAVLHCEVSHHPEVLVLLLKRFEFDFSYMTYVKINQPVDVPRTVHLPHFSNQDQSHSYKLYAFVEHSGELRYGHYISKIWSQEDDKWYIFDDSTVAESDTFPNLERSQRAYLLFYQKQKEKDTIGLKRTLDRSEEEGEVKKKKVKKPKQCPEEPPLHQSDQKSPEVKQLDIGDCSSNLQKHNIADANHKSPVDNNKMDKECIGHHTNLVISKESNEQEPCPGKKQQFIPEQTDAPSCQLSPNKDQLHRHDQSDSEEMQVSNSEVPMTAMGDDAGANSEIEFRNESVLTVEVQGGQEGREENYRKGSHIYDSELNQGNVCGTGDSCCESHGGCGGPCLCTDTHMQADQTEQCESQAKVSSGIEEVARTAETDFDKRGATDDTCSLEKRAVNDAKDEVAHGTMNSSLNKNELEICAENNIYIRNQIKYFDRSNDEVTTTKEGGEKVCSDCADNRGEKSVRVFLGQTNADQNSNPCDSVSEKHRDLEQSTTMQDVGDCSSSQQMYNKADANQKSTVDRSQESNEETFSFEDMQSSNSKSLMYAIIDDEGANRGCELRNEPALSVEIRGGHAKTQEDYSLNSHACVSEPSQGNVCEIGDNCCESNTEQMEQCGRQAKVPSGIERSYEEEVVGTREDDFDIRRDFGATNKTCSLEKKDINEDKDEVTHNAKCSSLNKNELVIFAENNISDRSQEEDFDGSNEKITTAKQDGETVCSDGADDLGEKSIHEGCLGQTSTYSIFSDSEKRKDFEQSHTTIQDVGECFSNQQMHNMADVNQECTVANNKMDHIILETSQESKEHTVEQEPQPGKLQHFIAGQIGTPIQLSHSSNGEARMNAVSGLMDDRGCLNEIEFGIGAQNSISNRNQKDFDGSNEKNTIMKEPGVNVCSDCVEDLSEKSVHGDTEKRTDFDQSSVTMQGVKEHTTTQEQKMYSEQLGRAEEANLPNSNACVEDQGRTGIGRDENAKLVGIGTKKERRPLLKKYDLYLESLHKNKIHSDCYEGQSERLDRQIPVPICEHPKVKEVKYSPTEYCHGATKSEVKESEEACEQRSVDAPVNKRESEQREIVGKVERHEDRLHGTVFQNVVVTRDEDTEIKKFILNKKQSRKDEQRDKRMDCGPSNRNKETPTETLAEGVENLTLSKGEDVVMETETGEKSEQTMFREKQSTSEIEPVGCVHELKSFTEN